MYRRLTTTTSSTIASRALHTSCSSQKFMMRKIGMTNNNMRLVTRRNMGGDGKSAYPSQAYAFDRKPGDKLEGWEIIYCLTMGSCFLAVVFGYGNTERESFRDWARREALAREKIVEEGGELEFGKFYSSKDGLSMETVDTMPVRGGGEE